MKLHDLAAAVRARHESDPRRIPLSVEGGLLLSHVDELPRDGVVVSIASLKDARECFLYVQQHSDPEGWDELKEALEVLFKEA